MKDDVISRHGVSAWLDNMGHPELADVVIDEDRFPSAQQEHLTDDDFETIRIHLSALKNELCNQRRWGEAKDYERLIDRFMSFASSRPEITEEQVREYCRKRCLSVVDNALLAKYANGCQDTISRQEAIDAVHKNYDVILDFTSDGQTISSSIEDILSELPSAQPERKTVDLKIEKISKHQSDFSDLDAQPKTHDKRTETHACDLISRQALCEYALNQKDKNITANDIMRFPSAQPESAKRTAEAAQNVSDEDLISRKEAIDAVCKSECEIGFCGIPCPEVNALKALPSAQSEQAKMIKEIRKWINSDTISRQAAIDELNKLDVSDGVGISSVACYLQEEAIRSIENLPSTQPERKRGKWIDYIDEGYVECPFCHSATNCDGNKDELHFCFSCGADMREVDDEYNQ